MFAIDYVYKSCRKKDSIRSIVHADEGRTYEAAHARSYWTMSVDAVLLWNWKGW